jgi:hypothetical protein
MTMIWHLATVSGAAERTAIKGLRQNGFTVVQPCLTVWKSVPKGQREKVKTPMYPGYLFLGQSSYVDLDKIHDPRTPIRIVHQRWKQERLFRVVCDHAFRELAGEFDKTGDDRHHTPKPMTGPLTRKLGTGLSCLGELLTRDDQGRLDLLTSGEMFADDEEDEDDLQLAA